MRAGRSAFISAFAVGAISVLCAGHARAWGPDAHRIVCAIAWDELSQHARDSVKATLDIQSRDQFADSCTFAEEYRLSHPETAAWHLLSVPDDASDVNMARDCGKSCVVAEIGAQAQALEHGGPGSDLALKLLAGLVADVHQPLNVARGSDHNGRDLTGHFYGRETNFHAIWENGLLTHDGRAWRQIVSDLEDDIDSNDRATWVKSKPLDWANESLAISLAPTTYYGSQFDHFQFGPNYAHLELPVALGRLSRAGIRLAAMLNRALGDGQ
jgi:hypothetical protein